MFQLFQIRGGPFFFIVTLVTLFFLLHCQKIFVPYIFGCIVKTFEEKISLYNILSLYIVYCAEDTKAEEGICYSCHVVTARQDAPLRKSALFCAIYASDIFRFLGCPIHAFAFILYSINFKTVRHCQHGICKYEPSFGGHLGPPGSYLSDYSMYK